MEHALTLIVDEEHRDLPVELNHDDMTHALLFSADGEYLWSAGGSAVRMWRVKDGTQMAKMEVRDDDVYCLAVSKDERWVAAGTYADNAFVWDARTYERVFSGKGGDSGVDFSLDSSRLVSASMCQGATIWDIVTGKQVQTLRHEHVCAARYSPQGDRIATASERSVLVWDSNDGRLLLEINIQVVLSYNKGLHWRNDHLFVACGGKIQQINASTESKISEWLLPNGDDWSCVALSQHGEFIAYSTEHTVTFWDTATGTQLSHIQHPHGIGPITLSSDNRFLATGSRRQDGKLTIKSLPRVAASICLIRLWCTCSHRIST